MHLDVARALEFVHRGDPSGVVAQLAAHHARSGSTDLAVAWYQAAIESARHVFADEEVILLARLALDLIPRLPRTEARDDREHDLLIALGVALFATRGSSDETYAVYRRAKALAEDRGRALDPPTLRVLGNLAIVRRDYFDVRDLGETLLRHGDEHGDSISRVEGAYLIAAASCWLGELGRSRTYFERAIAAYQARVLTPSPRAVRPGTLACVPSATRPLALALR